MRSADERDAGVREGGHRPAREGPGPDDFIEKNDIIALFGPNKRLKQIQSDLAG